MATPMGCAVDTSGTLYVADTDNNRVLVFPAAHLAATTGTAAAKVLGQANFSSAAIAITQASLVVPSGCAFEAPDRLWIADSAPNRVIRHDNVSAKTDGALADGVLGQTSFTDPVPATSASGLDTPRNVTAYQGTLFVADVDNQRIIRHANAAAKANGAAADGVLGQPNFTSTGSSNGAANLNGGFGLAVDESGRLYVGQIGNHRVTLFDGAAGKANGAAAETVLGQIAFGTSFSSNLDNRMFDPHGVAVDSVNHRLVVADRSNHRVLIFQATAPLPVAVSTFTLD
jgi:sugar lactone lactonase YvrE